MVCHQSDHQQTCNVMERAEVLKQAPSFSGKAVIQEDFKTISLSDYKGKYLVLFFYPLDFTFVCPTEIIAFSDRYREFNELGAEVVGCSVDSEYSHLAWTKQPRSEGGLSGLKIPLLSDLTKCISARYGVLMSDGTATRGTFIIDPEGIVRHYSINEPGVGRSVDETLRLLKAIQFHAKHGEVCPANWTPGQPTIIADPQKSRAYFASKP